jgi:hypothetical protein
MLAGSSASVYENISITAKNWMSWDSVRGVKARANLFSQMASAKANVMKPHGYLRGVYAF